MGMPALYITAISTVFLVYADFQDWRALTIFGIVLAASAAIAYTAKKHSYWAAAASVTALIAADAIGRGMNATESTLHASVSLGDFGYGAFFVATVGWLGGYLMRDQEENAIKTPMAYAEPQAVTTKNSIFTAPARTRQRNA